MTEASSLPCLPLRTAQSGLWRRLRRAGPMGALARAVRAGALILLGWSLLAVLEALASHVDASHRGPPAALAPLLVTVLLEYLPLVLNSWILALLFHRWPERLLRPGALLLVLLLSMLLFLPLLTVVDVAVLTLRAGQPLDQAPARLAQLGRLTWWYNLFVVGLAFLAQLGYSFWRRGQQQELAAQRACTEQLQLRLGLLQGQLKPHFLFNALNSISALMRTADAALAEQALARLEALLNHALAAGQGRPSSVGEELDFLRAYLALQGLRFGDRMQVDWDIGPCDWAALACPPLLFQPLAENAVHHGVEPHQQPCRLQIALRRDAGMVQLRIANPLLAPARPGHGLGLKLSRERLALLYGARATLDIETDPHHYAVTLRFPA